MIRCLIVDDEDPARALIQHHLSPLAEFTVVGSVSNGLDAFTFIEKTNLDLIFLDINMPGISGLKLIRSLTDHPKIIITTAYREYAANAYDLDVLDYLVKPITGERFMKSISKYLHSKSVRGDSWREADDHDFFKLGREQVKIFYKDIIFIEGFSDYVKIHTVDRFFIVSEKLNSLDKKLPDHKFIRIHKSFIIARDKVISYSSAQVKVGNHILPLGRLFKDRFLKRH